MMTKVFRVLSYEFAVVGFFPSRLSGESRCGEDAILIV